MTKKNIPFSPPYITEETEAQVLESLRSGWITTGPKVRELEGKLKEYLGYERSICVSSWTLGAMVVLKWFGIKPGDEVIIPSYTYAATALVAIHMGATVKMVDVDDNFHLNVNQLRDSITPKTKVIMPVDIGGLPVSYQPIMNVVKEEAHQFVAESDAQRLLGRIMVFADAAHSFGAKYGNKLCNSEADIVGYSFHAVKNLTTAEGGAICFNDSRFSQSIDRSLRLHTLNGQTKDALSKTNSGNWKYDIVLPGLKANMPDICAAIGLQQINNYNHILGRRKSVFMAYDNYFSQFEWAQTPTATYNGIESSYHLYMLRIRDINEETRDAIMKDIIADGVSVNVHFSPLPLLTLFKDMGYDISEHPGSYNNFSREISLPIYPQLSDEDVHRVCTVVSECVIKHLS